LAAALFQNDKLKVLKLKDNKPIAGNLSVFFEALSQNKYLQELDLDDIQLVPSFFSAFSKNTGLR
jgi:hypothetical protein